MADTKHTTRCKVCKLADADLTGIHSEIIRGNASVKLLAESVGVTESSMRRHADWLRGKLGETDAPQTMVDDLREHLADVYTKSRGQFDRVADDDPSASEFRSAMLGHERAVMLYATAHGIPLAPELAERNAPATLAALALNPAHGLVMRRIFEALRPFEEAKAAVTEAVNQLHDDHGQP